MRSALILSMLLAGCASTGHLYETESGTQLQAVFTGPMSNGTVVITHPDGECRGEYSRAIGGSWGGIYATTNKGQSVSGSGISVNAANQGAAVATCPGGRLIECEFITGAMRSGSGICRDNRGKTYRLLL